MKTLKTLKTLKTPSTNSNKFWHWQIIWIVITLLALLIGGVNLYHGLQSQAANSNTTKGTYKITGGT